MADVRRPWRWQWLSAQDVEAVPFWLRIGPGPNGAAHGIVLGLVRLRESRLERPAEAFRRIEDIADDARDQWDVERVAVEQTLARLEADGIVEAQPAGEAAWRATPLAVDAIAEAYAHQHPLAFLDRARRQDQEDVTPPKRRGRRGSRPSR